MYKTIAIATTALMFTACSTIVTPKNTTVKVNSPKSGQEFHVLDDDGFDVAEGVTPSFIRVANEGDSSFTYVTSCAKQIEESEVNGWVFGNILFGGLIGLTIDLIKGYSNEPNDKVLIENCPSKEVVASKHEDNKEEEL